MKDEIDMTVGVSGLTVLGGGAYDLKRATATHPSSYWATPGTYLLMDVIARDYQGTFPNNPILTVTEGSLQAGGLFDYQNTWTPPHKAHREGRNVDVRSHGIPEDNRDEFEKIASENGAKPKLEFPGQLNEHYHLTFPN